jgi:hypothetical protein
VSCGRTCRQHPAIEAGWRQRSITVSLDVESAARTLRRYFAGEAYEQLVAAMQALRGTK